MVHILAPTRTPDGTVPALKRAGVTVTEVPFTEQVRLPLSELTEALAESWDWLVVTSVQTAAILREVPLPSAKVAAVGPATAAALAQAGLSVDLVADPGGGAALVAAFPPGPGRVLLPGADEPSPQPARGLAELGWTVRHVPVYRTVAVELPEPVVAAWRAGQYDAFVVTAGSVARAGVDAAGLLGPPVVAIGEPSARAARELGLVVAGQAERPNGPSLAAAVLEALRVPRHYAGDETEES